MVGRQDISVTSVSDTGLSGGFTPFIKIYDGFYFTPEKEPCDARYLFDKSLKEEDNRNISLDVTSFDVYVGELASKALFADDLKYEKIEIVEKID